MPKIGPNKVSIDPKAYAARVTSAKKRVAQMDPATKAKIKDMYPKVTREDAVKQALDTKKAATFRAAAGMKKSKLNKKVYGEAVDKAFEANKKAREKTPAKKTPARMPAAVPSKPIGDGTKKKVRVMPVTKSTPKTTKKAPTKKVVQMPSKINPFKMTPAQKAKYLQNPERYDG